MTGMKSYLLFIALTAAGFLSPGSMAFSAKISAINTSCFYSGEDCGGASTAILIEGMIEKGDAKKFSSLVWTKLFGERGPNTFPVILRSPGGSVYEAMEIGNLIRRLMLGTLAPISDVQNRPLCLELEAFPERRASCVCASACFLIYAAGAPRNAGYVLLHRPFVDQRDNARLSLDSSTKLMATTQKDVSDYLARMEIPREYVETMFSTPSNMGVPIEHSAMRDRIAGYPSAIQEWLMAKCRTTTYGQNIAAIEAGILGGGGDKFFNEWSRQDKARNACEEDALSAKRNAAAWDWGPELAPPEQAENLKAWGRIFKEADKQSGRN